MKKFLITLSSIIIPLVAFGQDDDDPDLYKPKSNWKLSGTPSVKFSQNTFSNWMTGGADVMSLAFDTKAYAIYQTESFEWNNSLNLVYGINRQKKEGTRKTIDQMQVNTSISIIDNAKRFKYSAGLSLKSQFTDGYDYKSAHQWYLVSGFLAPGYVSASLGIDYIGIKHLNIHFAPLSEKTTIVRKAYYEKKLINVYYNGREPRFNPDEPSGGPINEQLLRSIEERLDTTLTSYGLAWGETSMFETGLTVQIVYDNPEIMKNIGFKTRLDIFSNYKSFTKPDIDWEAWLSFKFNDYFAFNVNSQLIYDRDIMFQETDSDGNVTNKSKVQFRNFMGIGVSYTFKN